MARNFKDLAARAKAEWSDEARETYDAAKVSFAHDMGAQAELGIMLAAARRARKLSQPQLSTASGVQQSEISRIENGAGNPTTETLSRLAGALGQRLTLTPIAGHE